MFGRRPPPPFWFVLLLGIAEALLLRWLSEVHGAGGVPSHTPAPPALAFWFLFGLVIGWIWTGVQVAGRITLQVLAWSVQALWAFARAIANASIAVGKAVIELGKGAWDFFVLTYENVIKPLAMQVKKFVDWAVKWSHKVFDPIFQFLDRIRGWVLRVYNDYVRPVLDIIDVTRRALRILASLGIEWARTLDNKLGQLEEKIQQPFTLILGKINELVNFVNRIATADGLFQRLAFIRSLERDIKYAVNAWHNSQSKPLTDDDRRTAIDGLKYKSGAEVLRETKTYLATGQGPRASSVDEWVVDLRRRLSV